MGEIILGVVLFIVGLACLKRDKSFFADAIKVWGEVTAYRSEFVLI